MPDDDGPVVTIFRNRLRDGVAETYGPLAAEMDRLARSMPGFLEAKTFTADDGERVTIVAFADRASHDAWRTDARHREAQRRGRSELYESYRLQVCRCEERPRSAAFVPFARHTQIRPASGERPFAGGSTPELLAWIRLVGDDEPPDAHRLIVLLDALAPSYAAVLDTPAPIPTIELTVRPGDGLAGNTSPWVLVRATTVATAGGWIDERLDGWATDGTHLGSAQQLRLLVAG